MAIRAARSGHDAALRATKLQLSTRQEAGAAADPRVEPWPVGLPAWHSRLDMACGTGLRLALLREPDGGGGQVYGFDHSPESLVQARDRVALAGWRHMTLFETPAQALRLPQAVDALPFHFIRDMLRPHAAR